MPVWSLSFLYLFLPASILLCLFSPQRLRPPVLLLLSGVFYYWAEGEYLLLVAGIVLFDYLMGLLIERSGAFPRLRLAVMVCSVTKSTVIFALYGVLKQLNGAHFPLGIGVICLTSCGYVIDCYFNYTYVEHNLVDYALMAVFFPKLYAGPLVYHNKIIPQFRNQRMTLEKIGVGGGVFLRGLAKKVLIGDQCHRLFVTLRETPILNMTTLAAWVMVGSMAFAAYFLLSGFCDMAKGLGLVFGIELPDNFKLPYRSLSVNEFFSRFNITVNRFIRRYIYLSLGAAKGSVLSGVFNILLVTILMGLWFGINLNMMSWGIFLAVFIIFERYCFSRVLEAIPPLFRWIYTTAAVFLSFALFAGGSLGESADYFRLMFGGGGVPAYNDHILYLLATNWLLLLIAAVCAVGLPDWISTFLHKHLPHAAGMGELLINVALLLITTAFLL